MKKRVISLLLALIMALSLLPVSVLAADDHTGQVHVTVENTTWAKADGAPWEGTLVDEWVTLKADSTMMSCIVDALTARGYTQTGADTGYISEINGIKEKDASKDSGWMGTLNDWFTSEGFANYTVANGKLKSGDEIAVQHTCNLGADIGGSFDTSDKSLKAVALSAGELNPAFSSGVHDYTMILPESVTALTVTPTASNKQNRVRIYVGGTEYGRKDAIPVQVGTVITLKVGNDGDAAPETYTIALQAAGTLLSGDNVSLTSIHQDGSAGTKVALTFDKETAAFTGKLANYTHLKQYNDGGFTVTLSDLPAGATAQLKSSSGKVLADFKNGVASTAATQFTGSGSAYFYIAVTAQGRTENYKLTLTKPGDYCWGRFIFSGTPDFDEENVFYGYPEGTLFQTDENGNPTGETGYAKGCWNYTVYVSPAVGSFGVSYFMNVMGNSGLKALKSKILVDGEVHIAERKALVPVMQAFAKKPVPLKKDKTVIEFIGTNSKDEKIEIHTTITVIVVKTTPAELTGFISALPSSDNLTYSEHYKIVMSYQRAYNRFTDEEKAQLSAETVKKLQDSVARVEELKKRHEGGIQAWIDLVNTFAGKVTAENYAQYYDAVQEAQVKYLEMSDAQRAEFSYINSAENAAVMTAYEAAYRTVNEQSILDGSSIGKPTEYYDDFMMGANHYNLDLGHEDTYYPAVFREIWTNRPTSLYPAYSSEKGLPYTLPGILKFDIKDDSIFEIKEVEGVYEDGGLSSFGTTPAMKYYLVPKKAGTTTFTVTFTDKAGNFYGQIPEIPVHVNSPEETAIQDLNKNLTNFTSLSNTSKYDNWTYDYGTQGAPFTFKVSGTNAKVSVYNYLQYNKDGTPVKTDYTPDAKGNVTILLKDGYNGIEVTADYQGHTVTQVYSLKGKVTRYVQENISRPGEDLRTGDTAGIWIIGRPTNIHKILRIYNPATTTVFYTDMPLQSVVNTDNQHDIYRTDENGAKKQVSYQPRVAACLTESGTITLTKGSSDSRGYGSKPGSEGDQGNTGGIADSTRYGFGMLADITLQVEDNPNFKLEPKYETVAENGGQVKAGDKLTISIPTLPIEQLAQDYKLQYCLLNYSTNIPGAEYIFSKWSKGGDSWEGEGTTPVGPEVALKSITFTVPKTTPAGTYRIYGGYLDVTHRSGGYEWLDKYAKFYRMEISDLTITVLKGDIETVEDLIDAIGADVTLNSEAAITAAKSAYDALSDEDKALVDADKVDEVIALIKAYQPDLVMNIALPYQDLTIMDACLACGVNYMDTANYEPENTDDPEWRAIYEKRCKEAGFSAYFDYSWQWAYAKKFEEAGLTALLGSGFDPGVTQAYCAYAKKHEFDTIDTIDILDCNGGDHGYAFATNFNPEINLREVSAPGSYWENGHWVEIPAMSIKREYNFDQVGDKDMYLLHHEEIESLAKNIPEAKRIRFFMTFGQSYLDHMRCLEDVGMLSTTPVNFNGQEIVPIQFLKALLPDPASLGPRTKGKTNIGCIFTGKKDGKEKTYYIYNVCDHQECYKEVGSQAISYTTGVPAMCGALMLLTGKWTTKGVHTVEEFDPDPYLDALDKYGLPRSESHSPALVD